MKRQRREVCKSREKDQSEGEIETYREMRDRRGKEQKGWIYIGRFGRFVRRVTKICKKASIHIRVGNTRRSCGQFLVTFLSDRCQFDLRRSCWPVPFLTLYKFFRPHLFARCAIRKKKSAEMTTQFVHVYIVRNASYRIPCSVFPAS